MAVDRRTLWLGMALIVVLIVAGMLWSSGGPATSASAPRAAPSRVPAPRKAPEAEQSLGQINLEGLKVPHGEPVDSGRNPFRFQPRPAPATAPSSPSMTRPLNQGPAGVLPPPVPAGPPPPPPIPLKFIGIIGQGAIRLAVLTDGKSMPVSGKEGDIILGQYRILKIGNESIEMAYVDGRGRRTIPFTGQ